MKKLVYLFLCLCLMPNSAFCIGKFFKDVGKKTKKGVEKGFKETKKVTRKAVTETKKGVTQAAKQTEKTGKQALQKATEISTAIPGQITRAIAGTKVGKWIIPNPSLRYDQVSYLTAHNSYAAKNEGFAVSFQQWWSIEEQLKNGVRGFMDDPHVYKGKVLLCHKSCSGKGKESTKGFTDDFRTFESSLKLKKDWLNKNRNEVLTIILDGTAPNQPVKAVIENIPGLKNIILTKKDWDPEKHDGYWPTLKWMQDNNKRLVIFVAFPTQPSDPFFYTWDYAAENWFATLDPVRVCQQRPESKKAEETHPNRRLSIFNHFGKVGESYLGNYIEWNSYDSLKKSTSGCDNILFKNPNFIALDHLDAVHDSTMKFINELNRYEHAKKRNEQKK